MNKGKLKAVIFLQIQFMKLQDIIYKLDSFDQEDTIYAAKPWNENSKAMVLREPDEGGVPPDAQKMGLTYFLEVSIANEFLNDWAANLEEEPTSSQKCKKVIEYATDDA